MKPVSFPEQNVVFAENQPEYLPLPAKRAATIEGEVTSCWRPTLRERIRILFTCRIYVTQLTFNRALQPLMVSAKPPL